MIPRPLPIVVAAALSLPALAWAEDAPLDLKNLDRDGPVTAEDGPPRAAMRAPADPEAVATKEYVILDLRWDRGSPSLVGSRPITFPTPLRPARVFGRFAVELFRGEGLVERVRFDFPLLGAADEKGSLHVASGLRTRVGVYFPRRAGAGTRLELVDRRAGTRWAIPLEVLDGPATP